MKVGDYIRTPYGIRKVKSIAKHDKYQDDGFYVEGRFIVCGKEAMKKIKSSPNIIDLIQRGDFVNGDQISAVEVSDIDGIKRAFNCEYESAYYTNEMIKSVVTKEQFESMKYEVK